MVTVKESTLKHGLCVGCGICKAVCPSDAITMVYNVSGEYNPKINDNCIHCKECVNYCPHTYKKNILEAKKINQSKSPNSYGIKKDNQYYVGHDKDLSGRKKSASGGIVTKILSQLLKEKKVDYVIHAKGISAKIGEPHFIATISSSEEQLNEKRSSFYSNIDFSDVIENFKNKNYKIVITGVPCVVRGLKKLFHENKVYSENKIYLVSLPCSHNVSGQFVDFLAESEKISRKESFFVNLRNKDEIKDANHFRNHFYKKDNQNKIITLSKKERFENNFTKLWRNYCFSLNVCHYCSDFWGYEGDISIKDAWGKWSKNSSLGESMVIVRNEEINNLLSGLINKGEIKLQEISFEEASNAQLETTIYKQKNSLKRIESGIKTFYSLSSGFFKYHYLSKNSKIYYRDFTYEVAARKIKKEIKFLNMVTDVFSIHLKIKKLVKKIIRRLNKIKRRT